MQLTLWSNMDGTGLTFESSGGFRLPNGAMRSPDASWIRRTRYATLTDEEKERFIPLCPDFVIELRSPSDSLNVLKEKMQEYMDNGAELGFLIDRKNKRVYIYRHAAPVEELDNPETVSGEQILPGFVLDLRQIWLCVSHNRIDVQIDI